MQSVETYFENEQLATVYNRHDYVGPLVQYIIAVPLVHVNPLPFRLHEGLSIYVMTLEF